MEIWCTGADERQDASVIRVGNDMPSAKITNISGTSGMTRSGCIFAARGQKTRGRRRRI